MPILKRYERTHANRTEAESEREEEWKRTDWGAFKDRRCLAPAFESRQP